MSRIQGKREALRPIDSGMGEGKIAGMKKKPLKLEEPAAPYGAKAPAKAGVPVPSKEGASAMRFADLEEVRKTNAKLMEVHRTVLQKLAQ